MTTATTAGAATGPLPVLPPHTVVVAAGDRQDLVLVVHARIAAPLPVPVVVAVSGPADVLAAELDGAGAAPVRPLEHGTHLRVGHVYVVSASTSVDLVAVGDRVLADVRPPGDDVGGADALLRAAARVFCGHSLAVLLGPDGGDGCAGAREVLDVGGHVIAATSARDAVAFAAHGHGPVGDVAAAVLAATVRRTYPTARRLAVDHSRPARTAR